MPTKRKTKKDEKKAEAPEGESAVPDPVEKTGDEDSGETGSSKDSPGKKEDGQLFFSTDGSEPEQEKENPYLEKDSASPDPGKPESGPKDRGA